MELHRAVSQIKNIIKYYNFDINLNLFLLTVDGLLQHGNLIDDSILENLRKPMNSCNGHPQNIIQCSTVKSFTLTKQHYQICINFEINIVTF